MVRFATATYAVGIDEFYRKVVTEETFWEASMTLRIPNHYNTTPRKDMRLFRALFGVSPLVCVDIWNTCSWQFGTTPTHLLWAMLFLKVYASEDVLCSLTGCCRKTFRKWLWPTVASISNVKNHVVSTSAHNSHLLLLLFQYTIRGLTLFYFQIRFDDRFKPNPVAVALGTRIEHKTATMTVDGTDYDVYEQSPFSKRWYSHKFKRAGLRYEVGVCIQTGDIVWTHGPFAAGAWPDINIFRAKLKRMLRPGEMVVADKGYKGEKCIRTPYKIISHTDSRAMHKALARHETVNRRLKQFGVLGKRFRHELRKHVICFNAVAVATQLSFNRGEKPYRVTY